MNELTSYAVEFRYPGEMADRKLARRALVIAEHSAQEITGRRAADLHLHTSLSSP